MRFYTHSHTHYCGVDLHARSIYLCILDAEGRILYHRNHKATPEQFLNAIEPYREGLVVGVECMFSWYWMADLCVDEGIEFVLGHALYMRAVHGGKAKNDRIDAQKIAMLLRGGMFPMAYVYPKEMRSTRDLLRRRMHLSRKRSELLAHIQNTNSQYNLPEIRKNLRHRANRAEALERFEDPSVARSMQLDSDLIEFYSKQLEKVEWFLLKHARRADQHSIMLLRSVPGIGPILSMVILYEMHTVERFDTVQRFASYCRLVKCERESAGKRKGSGGKKMGNAYLKWAFSEAAVLFLRSNPEAQAWLERMTRKHNKPRALTILAHKIGRAVYFMLKRKQVFDQQRFLNS